MKRIIAESDLLTVGNAQEWRDWLADNHAIVSGIWLVSYKKSTGRRAMDWGEAVDVALCFGWIDSTTRSLDEERSIQYFTRRKPNSTWSKVNKKKVAVLRAAGLMSKAGLEAIKVAKANGSWNLLNDVEALRIPADLAAALSANMTAKKYFLKCSRSVKKMLLQWLVLCRTEQTRSVRIAEIVENAGEGRLPGPFRSVKSSKESP